MSKTIGRYLDKIGQRVIFANPENRNQTLTSRLNVTKKNVGPVTLDNQRITIKLANLNAKVDVPDCTNACVTQTEMLVVELSVSGSTLNSVETDQLVIDCFANYFQALKDYRKGWNLDITSKPIFGASKADIVLPE